MSELTAREKVVTWDDPMVTASAAMGRDGRAFLQAMVDGEVPGPPIAHLMGFTVVEIGDGVVTFAGVPDESVYNPIGAVHGGYVCTLLDSALGCAVHSTLPAGTGYTSIEIKVNYLRPLRAGTGEVRATGRVTKGGRRVAFAEGEVVDGEGKVVATAQSSLLVMPLG